MISSMILRSNQRKEHIATLSVDSAHYDEVIRRGHGRTLRPWKWEFHPCT